ncbi:MAG: MAPEG family protein [Rhizobiales bacterium]|nr:MAPEG family protein [Hyphomicrobiales bacterium]
MSSQAAVLTPVFLQVALTFALLVAMGRARVAARRAGQIRTKDVALGQTEPWPERPKQIARAYHNQLETPTLFYVAVAIALATGKADGVFVVLEWAWLVVRMAHAYVHVTSNHVPTRFRIFLGSVLALAAMWIWLAVRTFVIG